MVWRVRAGAMGSGSAARLRWRRSLRITAPCVITAMSRSTRFHTIHMRQHTTDRGSTMTFEEVLDQALEMLRRRGRVTYRALQRQFGLDDAYLADLKAEIIEAQCLAVDENGTVLVWTGGGAPTAEPPPSRTG